MTLHEDTPGGPNPSGLCMCGCGKRTAIARDTIPQFGQVKGTPVRFVSGHHRGFIHDRRGPNPLGLCWCGCGEVAPIATRSARVKGGMVAGAPKRYIRGHQSRSAPEPYRIDPDTGCWVWQWAKNPEGYGRWSRRSEAGSSLAHRAMYEMANGPIPEGLHLDHLCRNRACVNPDHLEPVTPAENNRRAEVHRRAEDNPRAPRTILTAAQVAEIRGLLGTITQREIARRFGVHQVTISNIKTGRSWKAS